MSTSVGMGSSLFHAGLHQSENPIYPHYSISVAGTDIHNSTVQKNVAWTIHLERTRAHTQPDVCLWLQSTFNLAEKIINFSVRLVVTYSIVRFYMEPLRILWFQVFNLFSFNWVFFYLPEWLSQSHCGYDQSACKVQLYQSHWKGESPKDLVWIRLICVMLEDSYWPCGTVPGPNLMLN